MLFKQCLGELLSLFNFVDDICIVNKSGIIEYTYTSFPEFYSFDVKEIIGKHIFDIYMDVDGNKSSLYEVLKTGYPMLNKLGTWKTFKGDILHTSSNTFPIVDNKEIIGAIELSLFMMENSSQRKVAISEMSNKNHINNRRYFCLEDIVTQNTEMLAIKQKIIRISSNESAVLICGDTGTGKEVVAQSIHSLSSHKDGPFISQNCAAIPETLLESIFFGTEKGIYTGAESRKGLFELAQNGTLFLDEVNSMSVGMQAKLLKAIEDKKIVRIGGQKQISVNVRIISAFNEEPITLIREKRLRRDLYYRLGTVRVDLPLLKDRKGDIRFLADYFIHYYNQTMNTNILGISEAVSGIFNQYEWPGNVRELKNVIESAYTMSPVDYIQVEHLPEYMLKSEIALHSEQTISFGEKSLKQIMKDYEKHVIDQVCKQTKSKTEAARLLNISKQSLNYRIEKWKHNKE